MTDNNVKFLKVLVFIFYIQKIQAQDNAHTQTAMAELEIANLELQDDYENVAETIKSSLISNTFSEKIKVRQTHAEFQKILSENIRQFENDIPPDLLRNWTLLVKPGDVLLGEQDWNSLVSFDVNHDELVHTATVHCKNGTQGCQYIKRGYESILEHSRNYTLLKKSWGGWQTLLSWRKNEYPNVLNLVTKAALPNGREDAKSYWEMLIEKDDAYFQVDEMWEQIKPLYFKLHNFVKTRLVRYYNISSSDEEIPVYLLGSNFGNDWSQIADIILPHPQLLHEANVFLNKTKIEDIYKLAEDLTKHLSLGTFGPKFWANSRFNMSFCENHLISFCNQEYSELLTCDKVSWSSYLDAFEVAMDVILRNIDYLNLARSELRYSGIDEAVKALGSILAIKNLRATGIWGPHFFGDESVPNPNQMTERLLIALRVLPKLAFYLAADKWRLHLLEHGSHHFEKSWWKFRREYQGVQGIFNNETDFLGDPYFTSNKPYLSKFLGTILQFQFLDYYTNNYEYPNRTIADNIGHDENFLTMLRERSSIEWPSLTANYHSIYDLSAAPLLEFFAPLEEYFQSAPLEQAPITTTTSKPTTTTELQTAKLPENSTEVPRNSRKKQDEDTEIPMPRHHEHVEENDEGPNHMMQDISMYIGLALLAAVVAIILYVIVSKRMDKKRRNNRRFQT